MTRKEYEITLANKEAEERRVDKKDDDKIRMELLPLDALYEIAKVLTFGAKKYGPNCWQTIDNAEERYKGALLRHLTQCSKNKRKNKDKESGLSHTAHMACNALFLLWFEINKK